MSRRSIQKASHSSQRQQALQQFGWTEGRNIRVDIRWGANDLERDRKYAAELIALTPDVVLAAGTLSVMALQRVSRTLPIVFVEVSDPVGAGLVARLDRPGGSTTGFMLFEYSLGAKWIELLKQVAPNVRRAAVIRDAANPAGIAQFGAIRTTASSLGVDVSPIDIRDAGDIERSIADLARSPNAGLVVHQQLQQPPQPPHPPQPLQPHLQARKPNLQPRHPRHPPHLQPQATCSNPARDVEVFSLSKT
jgi:ABC-type uncharacterized transport system substrate-binding protein